MSESIKNIVLVGRTGNGKSATGNTLLGHKLFNSKQQAGSVTSKCEMYRAAIEDGPIINVIDTPGLFDSILLADYITKEIINCLSMAEEGIHAMVFVLSARNRISQEEELTLNALQRIFGSKILDYFIVLFTGGDELEVDNQTLDDYLRDGCPAFLTRVLRLCGGRKVLFNNKTWDKVKKAEQLKQLLTHVADIEKQTGGKPYIDKMQLLKERDDMLMEHQRKVDSKKKHMVYARDLSIKLSKNSEYWSWLPLQYETSSKPIVHEAAVLEGVCWLDVGGMFHTKELSPWTKYEVVYLVKLAHTASGWETPVNLKLTLPGRARQQQSSVSLKDHIGKSWVEIPAGEFITSPDNDGEISFTMYETAHWQEGLIVKGVVIRPRNEGMYV